MSYWLGETPERIEVVQASWYPRREGLVAVSAPTLGKKAIQHFPLALLLTTWTSCQRQAV